MHVYKHLAGSRREQTVWNQTLLSGAQWQDKRQRAKTEIQQIILCATLGMGNFY